MDIVERYLGFIAAFAAAVAGIGIIWATVIRPARRHFDRVNRGMDTLLGYPPVLDPGSGREIQPATPPLAARVFDLEETNQKIGEALGVIAANQQALLDLERKYEVQERVAADFRVWQVKVDRALAGWIEEQDQLARVVRGEMERDDEGEQS